MFRSMSDAAGILSVAGNSRICAKVKVESAAMIAHTDSGIQFDVATRSYARVCHPQKRHNRAIYVCFIPETS